MTSCPDEWREIFIKQSVDKCGQINFCNLCVYFYNIFFRFMCTLVQILFEHVLFWWKCAFIFWYHSTTKQHPQHSYKLWKSAACSQLVLNVCGLACISWFSVEMTKLIWARTRIHRIALIQILRRVLWIHSGVDNEASIYGVLEVPCWHTAQMHVLLFYCSFRTFDSFIYMYTPFCQSVQESSLCQTMPFTVWENYWHNIQYMS